MGLRDRFTGRRGRRPATTAAPNSTVVSDTGYPPAAYDSDTSQVVHTDRPPVVQSAPGPRQAVNVQVQPTPPVVPASRVAETVVYEDDYVFNKVIQVIWFIVAFFEIMLAIRFLLRVLAANPESPFASFVYGLTGPLVWPFVTLFGTPQVGGSVFEWYTIFAMVVYWLFAWLLTRLLDLIWDRPVREEYVTREPVAHEHVVHDPVPHEHVHRERL